MWTTGVGIATATGDGERESDSPEEELADEEDEEDDVPERLVKRGRFLGCCVGLLLLVEGFDREEGGFLVDLSPPADAKGRFASFSGLAFVKIAGFSPFTLLDGLGFDFEMTVYNNKNEKKMK